MIVVKVHYLVTREENNHSLWSHLDQIVDVVPELVNQFLVGPVLIGEVQL